MEHLGKIEHKVRLNNKHIDNVLNKNRIFFNLKHHSLIQQVLINTLLDRTNCFIEDLARLLNIDTYTLLQVRLGKVTLTDKKSHDLISLFYLLSN